MQLMFRVWVFRVAHAHCNTSCMLRKRKIVLTSGGALYAAIFKETLIIAGASIWMGKTDKFHLKEPGKIAQCVWYLDNHSKCECEVTRLARCTGRIFTRVVH